MRERDTSAVPADTTDTTDTTDMSEAATSKQPAGLAPDAHEQCNRAHELLLTWYAAHGRTHLPWRATRDPYAVLVAEIMLQQTQVERVLPKYRAFMQRFPTLQALAEAPTGEVIKEWAGLGYNMRAVRLQTIARQTVETNNGALPATLDGLLALKGIGRYTAGAVACFAFDLPVATVDTNIRRVLWRMFRGIEPGAWPTGEAATRALLALAAWALPQNAAYDWQQALMDLGATICVSRKPLCEQCPLATVCAAYAAVAAITLFPSGEALARLRDERAAVIVVTPANSKDDVPALARVAERRAGYQTDHDDDTQSAGAKQSVPRTRPTSKRPAPKTQPFTSTPRYFRGRIVDALRGLPAGERLTLVALGSQIKPDFTADDLPWLRVLAEGLARDGLARLETTDDGEWLALP
ncbi:MAG: A/G-specific adenine glycosylase [Ktedonobacterales bacterium]